MTSSLSNFMAQPVAPPFRIELAAQENAPNHFTPSARVVLTSSLKSCGLLAHLSDEEVRTLVALLALVNTNGHVHATAPEVAQIIGVSEDRARRRLDRLTAASWRSADIVRLLPREDTHAAYVPTRAIVDQQDAPREMAAGEVLPLEIPQIVEVPAKPSIRERVIAHSRETYARPRAEVERIVADQLGHAPTEETDSLEGEARRELRALGVQRETIDQLIAQHGPDPILDQCRWLPFRGTIRNPAGYIAVAIAKGFEPPAIVRQQMEGGV